MFAYETVYVNYGVDKCAVFGHKLGSIIFELCWGQKAGKSKGFFSGCAAQTESPLSQASASAIMLTKQQKAKNNCITDKTLNSHRPC